MVQTRYNQSWHRRGLALLWDVNTLRRFTEPDDVLSMRQFFAMVDNWPDDLPAGSGDTLVVAGIEGCLDVLSSDDAEQWLDCDLAAAIGSFHGYYQRDAGLIFWSPSGRHRLTMSGATERYSWKHRGAESGSIPIGNLLFSGAENEVTRLMGTDDSAADFDGKDWIGLHHVGVS